MLNFRWKKLTNLKNRVIAWLLIIFDKILLTWQRCPAFRRLTWQLNFFCGDPERDSSVAILSPTASHTRTQDCNLFSSELIKAIVFNEWASLQSFRLQNIPLLAYSSVWIEPRTTGLRTWRPSWLRHLVPVILAIINRAINFDFSSSWVINCIAVHVGVERMDMSYRFSWLLRRVMFIQCGSKTNSHSLWRRFQCAACLTRCSCFPCFSHFQWFNRCRISNELIEKTLPSWFTALVEMLRTWF